MIAGTGGIRYDIFAGDVTRDDTMIVSPFRDRFYAFSRLNSDEASAVLETMQVFLPGDPRPLPFGSMVATSAPDPELVRGLSLSLLPRPASLLGTNPATSLPHLSFLPLSVCAWMVDVVFGRGDACLRETRGVSYNVTRERVLCVCPVRVCVRVPVCVPPQPEQLYTVICLDFDLSRVRTAVQTATADPSR